MINTGNVLFCYWKGREENGYSGGNGEYFSILKHDAFENMYDAIYNYIYRINFPFVYVLWLIGK